MLMLMMMKEHSSIFFSCGLLVVESWLHVLFLRIINMYGVSFLGSVGVG